MQKFTFKVKDELGLHARPAGELVKEAVKCSSKNEEAEAAELKKFTENI